VPARVVTGYQGGEINPHDGSLVVRQSDAHAWVEVWLDGAWTTWDPTPASELVDHAQLTTPWLSAFGDLLGAGWASFLAWLDQRSWTEMIALALAVFLLPIGLRLWRRRRGVERAVGDGPLPCYLTLEAALAQLGVVRAPSETLEQLAQRLERAEDRAAEGAPLVLRYAALRYGDLGDEASLRRDIERWTQSLDGSLSAGSGTAG
ncbi:MAG: DUF4129 domain-containing protein, partial [Myxococcales bacterium]|nr:DUF4129 domain-containing protein [Myxococcales bacterium]